MGLFKQVIFNMKYLFIFLSYINNVNINNVFLVFLFYVFAKSIYIFIACK